MMDRSDAPLRPPTLFAVGHGVAATGFARIMHGILGPLTESWNVHLYAVNHHEDRLDGAWTIHGNPRTDDPSGVKRYHQLVRQLEPDVVFFMGDLWFCALYAPNPANTDPRPFHVAYCPVDGEFDKPDYLDALASFDRIVLYNEFGRDEILKACSLPTESLRVVPHGIDLHDFHPLDADARPFVDRRHAKRVLFGGDSGLEDSFLVLNANKNQPRKRLDLTLEGFARFARGKPSDVLLYLHTSACDGHADIRKMASFYGVSDRLVVTEGFEDGHPAVDSDRLNLIYNACDVGINTSTGEGWGLVSFEHAATGAPQIVPRHSACTELWEGAALLLPPRTFETHAAFAMRRGEVEPDDVAKALERLYSDREFRAAMGKAAFLRANRSDYSWNCIAEQWRAIFQEGLCARESEAGRAPTRDLVRHQARLTSTSAAPASARPAGPALPHR